MSRIEKRFKITVLTYYDRVLNFTVSEYTIEHGSVQFIDEFTGEKKYFPLARCQLEEISDTRSSK